VVFGGLVNSNGIIYWISDDGALHAKIEGKFSGKPASEE